MINKNTILKKISKIISEKNIISDEYELCKYNKDWRGFYNFKSICLLFPQNNKEIKKILILCNKENIKIVPQGGNTSLTGSSVPSKNNYEIILNFTKMNKIIKIDKLNELIEVEAGATLDSVKKYAEKHNFYFPISLASLGSCQIGGNIATNAGGINALKYGSMNDNIRGLEVILANGIEISSMSPMKKNNTGYNLKNLFCGSEGTLGIITKALLRVYPKPEDNFHCFFGLKNINKTVELYKKIKYLFNDKLESAEIIPNIAIEQTIKHGFLRKPFFKKRYNYYLLLKFSLYEKKNLFENNFIEEISLLKHIYEDVIIPQSLQQEKNLWDFRDNLVESYKIEGKYITNDISLPIEKISNFIQVTSKKIQKIVPKTRIYSFGHLGDGNIHFNMIEPANFTLNFDDYRKKIYAIVNESVFNFGGSFSAEHGIGMIKKQSFKKYKKKNEINTMKTIKKALDPKNILNPGKIFDL